MTTDALLATVVGEVEPRLSASPVPPVVQLLGRAARLADLLDVVQVDAEAPASPSPDVVVVWLDDEPATERRAVLEQALRLLPPAGRLLLVASVGGPAPSFAVLHDDVVVAGGAMVHVDDVASVRWPGEQTVRGVVVVVSSLDGRTAR